MPVIVVGTEKNFDALRPRLLSGKVSTAAKREVADAIAAANPHVDPKALAPALSRPCPNCGTFRWPVRCRSTPPRSRRSSAFRRRRHHARGGPAGGRRRGRPGEGAGEGAQAGGRGVECRAPGGEE